MLKTIDDMSVSQLQVLIQSKEKEYNEAIKEKKVFWEVKKILEQKRSIEKELIKKQNNGTK